nr:Replicase [Garlic yellow curl virus]
MAFTYKTPVESLLSKFTSDEQSKICSVAADKIASIEKAEHNFFSYHMSDEAKKILTERGVRLSVISHQVHSHPVCKTVENHILYTVMNSYIDNSFYVVSIKSKKLEYLRARNKMPTLSYINRYVSAKDVSRYGYDSFFNRIKDSEVSGRADKKKRNWFPLFERGKMEFTKSNYDSCDSNTLRDLIPQALLKKGKRFFLHDEFHYWSFEDLNLFLCAVKPEVIIATHVFPKEILKGVHESYNKWMYDFKVEGDKLFYYPDGCLEEGYEQPMSGCMIYRLNSFTTTEGDIYTISLVYNLFSHSVFQITRGSILSETQRGFSGFHASPTNELSAFGGTILNTFGVKSSLIKKMYMYLRTLKKPDIESAMAKLRQLEPDPSGKVIIFVENFSEFLLKHKTGHSLIEDGLVNKLERFLISLLPNVVRKNFENHYKSNLCEFISNLEDDKVVIDCMPGDVNTSDWSFLFPKIDEFRRKLTESVPDLSDQIVVFFRKHLRFARLRRQPSEYFFSNLCVELVENTTLGEIKFGIQHFLYRFSESELKKANVKIKCGILKNDYSFFSKDLRLSRYLSSMRSFMSEIYEFVCDYLLFRLKPLSGNLLLTNVSFEETVEDLKKEKRVESRCREIHRTAIRELEDNKRFLSLRLISDLYSIFTECGEPLVGAEEQLLVSQEDINQLFGLDSSMIDEKKEEAKDFEAVGIEEDPFSSFFDKSDDTEIDSSKEDAVLVKSSKFLFCKCGLKIVINSFEREINVEGLKFTDFLNGRIAAFYSRDGSEYSYNGAKHLSKGWLSGLDEMIKICGEKEIDYNQCLVQKYDKNGKIGFHSDNEKCYPKDNKILTVNASGLGLFRIKCCEGELSFQLDDGSFFLMPGGFQKTHRHAIEALTERISFTFRSTSANSKSDVTENLELIDTFSLSKEFYRIKLSSVHTISKNFTITDVVNFNEFKVSGDGNCFWHCITGVIGGTAENNRMLCASHCDANELAPSEKIQLEGNNWAEDESIFLACSTFSLQINLFDMVSEVVHEFKPLSGKLNVSINLIYNGTHFNLLFPKEGCVIRAIAEAVQRNYLEILGCLSKPEHESILRELSSGQGIPMNMLENCFRIFGIHALVAFENTDVEFNQNGSLKRKFSLKNGHIEYLGLADTSSKFGDKKIRMSKNVEPIISCMSGGHVIEFTPSLDKAKKLEESFIQGHSGKILCSKFGGPDSILKKQMESNAKMKVWYVVGTFGSGKSYGVKEEIKKRLDVNFLIISPRKKLAEVFKRDLGLKEHWKKGKKSNFEIVTFETALKYKSYKKVDIVILDELQLFPPGYLDLFIMVANLSNILVLGDPAQSSYDNESDRDIFEGCSNDLVSLLSNRSYKYIIKTKRFHNSFILNRLPCAFNDMTLFENESYYVYEDMRKEVGGILKNDVILCSSFDEKKSISYILGGRLEVLTFGESTGLTFKKACVVLTQNVRLTDERRILVALSRASYQTNFLNNTGEDFRVFVASLPGSLLFKYCSAQCSVSDLKNLLPGEPTFIDDFLRVGHDEVDREARMIGDPWLKTMIFLGQREFMEEEQFEDIQPMEIRTATHHPVSGINTVRARIGDSFRPKEEREFRIEDAVTEQFRDSYNIKDFCKTSNQCELFEAIYPRHKGTDSVTFLMAVKKRLSFSDPMINESKYNSAKTFGLLMLNHFLRYVPLKDNRDEEMFSEARSDFERKKLEKNIATIENHSGRSSADWDIREAFLFMKSQLCTKFEKRFCDAKAGQTLACFSHIVLCRFAPWIRYIEKKVFEVLPPNFYIHSGKNFDQLKDWVLKSDFSGECTESDYEAFDSSQDATILSFEVELMRYLNVPHDVIEDYKFIKFNLYSKLGIFEIMRFTGEAGTFLFNTLANICFTLMRYKIRGDECIAFAGDDMCANSHLRVTGDFEHILDRMKLKAKVEHKAQASFCGWVLGPYGIYKKPQLVLERFMISKEKGVLHECIDNYAIEVSYGYRMGDRVFDYMDEEEIECQNLCIRTIILNQHLMKETALSFYSGNMSKLE